MPLVPQAIKTGQQRAEPQLCPLSSNQGRPKEAPVGAPLVPGPVPAGTLTTRPQVLLGVEVALEHALIEEHVAHGLRDNDIHLLRERDLFYLPGDDHDAVGEVVTLHQDLWVGGPEGSRGSLHPLIHHASSGEGRLLSPCGHPIPSASFIGTLTRAMISHSLSPPSGPYRTPHVTINPERATANGS